MWSFKSLQGWLAVVGAAVLLSGCLQPMYAPGAGRDIQAELAAISISPIEDRLGHYLTTELQFAFRGGRSELPPKYKLEISLRERVQTPLVDTISGRTSAATVMVDADYKLIALAGGEAITQGVAFTMASYDRSSQRFANIRAARDAEIRDAKTLADQIRTRIVASLAGQG
jgi:LPS-assembly lipoprotein